MVCLTMTKRWLNLGFTGFRRGYDFYKSDWKYLNDPTMRGGFSTGVKVNGLLVPAGSTTCMTKSWKER